MSKRAAICVGVDRAGSLPTLQAAVKGASDFQAWAKTQRCDTTLLVDSPNQQVTVADIFAAVKSHVDAGTYSQLIVYFSGHGILQAPGVEYWLLSQAPENANEAVNLSRSVENARNSNIPHVVFVSDACRSSVTGPPLSGVIGGSIFPNTAFGRIESEVDIFYATRPGDPAWEIPVDEATRTYRGIFTGALLAAVNAPEHSWLERVGGPQPLSVITSRKLKGHLEATVPTDAAAVDVRIRQSPLIRVETALPNYFAAVDLASVQPPRRMRGMRGPTVSATLDSALAALSAENFEEAAPAPPRRDSRLAESLGLTAEVQWLTEARGREHFETHTGFTIHGARPLAAEVFDWHADQPFSDPQNPLRWHLRLGPRGSFNAPASLVLTLESTQGRTIATLLAVLPEFVGTVVVDQAGRVTSVSYVPSDNSFRSAEYQARADRLERMRAFAAVAGRHGRFEISTENAHDLADRIRQQKNIDPTLGLYAAYAYAQVGKYEDVVSVFDYMRAEEDQAPVLFDVVQLATRYRGNQRQAEHSRFAPFAPMLSQGWALLAPEDPLFRPIHARLRPHLIPSLWTTLDEEGATAAAAFVRTGEVD